MRGTKLNIVEMAKKAGVSVATISRAMNAETRKKVAPKTLERVDALIKKYGYTPNMAARNLRQTATKTIGVIFPYFPGVFYHPYFINIISGVADGLFETDYQFKTLLLREERAKWDQYDFGKGEQVDGLIVTHWPQFFTNKSVIETMDIPCVVVSDLRENMKSYFVTGDQISGGRQVAEHFYKRGHKRIAVFTGLADSTDGEMRLKGLRDYLETKNIALNPDWIIRADYRGDKAYQNVDRLLQAKDFPTAIFCLNDEMAFGVMRRLSELNIACPEKISVVGYDNDPRGSTSNPPLTTINVPLYDIARKGAGLLIEHLKIKDSDKLFKGHTLFPVRLVERGSVKDSSSCVDGGLN